MKRIILLLLVASMMLAGCTQYVVPNETHTPTDSVSTPNQEVTTPTDDCVQTSTEPSEELTYPTEPTYIATWDIPKYTHPEFKFGQGGVAMTMRPTMLYPEGFVEQEFEYMDIVFYARVIPGDKEISRWDYTWETPYTDTSMENIHGVCRTYVSEGIGYNSIRWYDAEKNLTYILDYIGDAEAYKYCDAIIFLDILSRPLDTEPCS